MTSDHHAVRIGPKLVGSDEPVYIVAEIGINHNGDVGVAKQLIEVAAAAGADAVKFQKRTPEISTPVQMRDKLRDTPWGEMTYLQYRHRLEFSADQYDELIAHAWARDLEVFASPWDVPAVEFLVDRGVRMHKVASACLTDLELLRALRETGRPLIVSTGMSTLDEIDQALEVLGTTNIVLLHTTSSYPMAPQDANLRLIQTLKQRYGVQVGYSGHERGLQISLAAVALGACLIERHVTLDRTMWGSDQAASLEPRGLETLVRDIRIIEQSLGDGQKRLLPSEGSARSRLRRLDPT